MLRKHEVFGLLMLVALLFSACQPIIAEPEVQPSDEDVTAAVNAVWEEYAAAVVADDAERWIAQWTDDGVQMPPDEPFVEGKDNIFTRVGMVMQVAPADEFVITPLEIRSVGDWAFSRGVYTVTFTIAETGEQGLIDGKFMTILQRQPDGSWKIHRDIYNSNVPPAQAPVTDVDAVTEAINANWREYEASILAGDPDRWIDLWAEDGVQLPPGNPPVVGKEAIYDRISADLEAFEYSEFVINNEDVEVNGDLAFARGNYVVTLAAKDGGDPISVDGKYMTIMRQQPDGSWKISRDIFNSNVP